ncbi:MAG: SRPBCC family protein [Acidimicrobiales bacterium]|nr:SRPBCC family protein [Acidimicrobiales bacterium]
MPATERVRIVHRFRSDPATVFAALGEHENLGAAFGAKITRLRDGDTHRNGVGSARTLKVGPLPGFVETVTTYEEPTLIEYEITEGSPLVGHWGRQEFSPTGDGGTRLEYTIGFDAKVPGLAAIVAAGLKRNIRRGLPSIVE